LSVKSKRIAMIYAYSISLLLAALIIFLAIVVIIKWADPSTSPAVG